MGVSILSKARAVAFAMKGCLSYGLVMYDWMAYETSKGVIASGLH